MMWPVFGTREKLHVRLAWTPPQALEMLRVPEHFATLLGQGGELRGELALPCHTDCKDLLGFLPSRRPAEGWQAQGNASRILRLAHPMAFGHPQERFDGVGADRQADVIEA
jgi:hypothetical protein